MGESKHTPGPWRWEVNERCKQVNLCGGGGQPFDLTVMDLRRWGMSGSKMRFRDPALDGMNLMHPIEHWLATVPGREHHKTWFQTINHPDARLIAAAPEMLEALRLHKAWSDSERTGPDYGGQTRDTHPDGEAIWSKWWNYQLDICARASEATDAVIAKAEGR